jgi:predicted acyl esterase
MRDGKALAADIYVPRSATKSPVVLIQTPYDRKLLRRHWTAGINDGPNPLFTDANYAFVVTDWRGRYESKDALAGQPADLASDGFDTVSWIVKQEWSNGRVGTWGPSALGHVQYETARAHPPGLICAVPMVMPLNLDYDIYFPSGVMWEDLAGMLTRLGFVPNLRGTLAQHPLRDSFWAELPTAHEIKPSDLAIPMLFIGSWYDIYTDSVISGFDQVRASAPEPAKAHSKLIMGPWVHAGDVSHTGDLEFPAADHYGLQQAHAFFDHWLREKKNGFDDRPAITYLQMGADDWRTTDHWPPAGTAERDLYLRGDRSLRDDKPPAADPLSFTFDPAHPLPTVGGHVLSPELTSGPRDQREKVESRADVVVFTGQPLQKPLEVDGKVRVRLYVSSDRRDTDFTAILTDVYPDGRSMLIGEGVCRMRLRNSLSKEELITPDEIYPITVEVPHTALTFLAGHRVRLIVSSSDYPKFAVNWNDGGPMYTEGPGMKALNRIYVDPQHPSAILLPTHKQN